MGQTTLLIMILTLISKVFGFVRESVMAAYIGAGDLKSIYTTATTIPTVIFSIVASGILSVYIPTFNKAKNEGGEKEANKFTNDLINVLMFYGLISFLLIVFLAKPISKMLSPDLSGKWLNLATNFTVIMMFSTFAYLYGGVIRGYLNIKNNFVDPVLIAIIMNLFIIVATVLTGIYKNPYILIIGALLGNIFQFARFPYVAKKLGFKYKIGLNFKNKYVKHLMILLLPIIFSNAASQLSLIVDNSMASAFFGKDSISKLFYAKTMLGFISGVVTTTIATVSFPEIARLAQKGNINGMKCNLNSAIIFTLILVLPATFGMMTLSDPIIKLVFERNAFTASDTSVVASLLVSYAPFVIFAAITEIISKGFYSLGDSKTPVLIIIIQQIINITLNVVLSKLVGLNGLALSTTISTAIGSVLIIIVFIKKFGNVKNNSNKASLIKLLTISIIMCIAAKFLFDITIKSLPLIFSLGISVLIGGIIYLIGAYILKVPEFDLLIESVKTKSLKDKRNKNGN